MDKNGVLFRILRHKRGVIMLSAALIAALAAVFIFSEYTFGVNVYYDGEIVASVTERAVFEEYLNDVETRFSEEPGLVFKSAYEFDYVPAIFKKDSENDFSHTDAYLIGGDASKMYVLKVDDRTVGANTDKDALLGMLDDIKDKYASGIDGECVAFDENIQIEEEYAPLSSYKSIEMMYQILTVPHKSKVTYTVRDGDTLVSVASSLGMSLEVFEKYNPEITPAMIRTGTELEVIKSEYLLTVRVNKTVTMHEPIEYETVTHMDSEKYVDEILEIDSGHMGEKLVTKRVTMLNGVVVNAEELESKVIEEPKSRVILQGTKPLPSVGVGIFHMPVSGYISSYYGVRGAGTHSGLDIAAPFGEAIYACDNGEVEFVGENGVYGLMVIIDHKNGYKTLYAHMSKAVVKEGDKVKQDEKIGEVGATGNATGNHLHLEIRKDGVPLNPGLYLE